MQRTSHASCEHDTSSTARGRCNRERAKLQTGWADAPVRDLGTIWEDIKDFQDKRKLEHAAIVVNPNVWAKAMEIAGGNKNKIEILSATRVKVSS